MYLYVHAYIHTYTHTHLYMDIITLQHTNKDCRVCSYTYPCIYKCRGLVSTKAILQKKTQNFFYRYKYISYTYLDSQAETCHQRSDVSAAPRPQST
jgi:hypothetical protein